jgi:hypothetical protein
MKTIILSWILLFGTIIASGIFGLKAMADSLSPLDYANGYKKFEISVGFDQENGRYYTYHYEF